MRVAFLTSHPIQYHANWFRALAAVPDLDFRVLYCHDATAQQQADAGFGVAFSWDRPLLGSYKHTFLRNVSRSPSVTTFGGLDTPEIADQIRSRAFDAVVVNGWHYKSAWQAIVACWRSRVPVLVRSDSHLHTERGLMKRAAKKLPYRAFIPRLDACLPVGRWSADYFLHYGARPERVHVVPHAVDSDFATDAATLVGERQSLREVYGFKEEQVVYAFAGKFIEIKRPMDFVCAVQAAHQQNPGIVGLMVGDGPLRQTCEEIVAQSGIPVRFAGFLNQSAISQIYVLSDALVLPSSGETWGLVVNEAMACGRPVLVSDRVGCGPDLVCEGETGFTFPMGDVAALSNLMVHAASTRERLTSMGWRARERMRGHSVSRAVQGLMNALSQTVR